MRVISNKGKDRALDHLRAVEDSSVKLHALIQEITIFGMLELDSLVNELDELQLILPELKSPSILLGRAEDRAYRNRLQNQWLSRRLIRILSRKTKIRQANDPIPNGLITATDHSGQPILAIQGISGITTSGLGITPGNPYSLVNLFEQPDTAASLQGWFNSIWASLPEVAFEESAIAKLLHEIATDRSAKEVYGYVLQHLFSYDKVDLDDEAVLKTATGIQQTKIWSKLYSFQKDAVLGAIDKLNNYGGCIIADSVGLGKTFEALAVIKYFELRNDRVLVLTPKRLRDNWILYRANDRRNPLAEDRFSYDVLNHTDLSRDQGRSGDIELAHVNWGNYDLVVIDESHNFRNKISHKDRESRYERLMQRIIQEGVKTRVLMLSATPVNNRLADLKNQIAFITEGRDNALADYGIKSIEVTTQRAQSRFNIWLKLPEAHRTPERLIEMLGFDYFKLLDLLTIARSRKHIEKYYGLDETGHFPERLPPINVKPDVDTDGQFPSIAEINRSIRKLNLAAYAPLRYVFPSRRGKYDEKYSTRLRNGRSVFHQADREESLVQLMRVNLLKRMESSVHSFALTLQRQLENVERLLAKISAVDGGEITEIDFEEVDLEDPAFESLVVGDKVKVLLQDVDRRKWRQDLEEDKELLLSMLGAAKKVTAERDAKLNKLREIIRRKIENPINPDNKKILIFSAFADTADYLYANLAGWAQENFGVHAGLITGTGGVKTTLPSIRKDMGSALSAFAPEAQERPQELASEGEIDLLIATDCISEGQNLQDCDCVVNYDIHWNPVRIVQRFGRIDRIGSPNQRIQLVNFWPNIELDEYINLEARVTGRMVLLDISATGEENVIEVQNGDLMNDLEYRRKQLLQLQEKVIDLEDLSTGISITDLGLSDFRMDLARLRKAEPKDISKLPQGLYAAVPAADVGLPPGALFCLELTGGATKALEPSYPMAPYVLVHVGKDGAVHLPYTQTKRALDALKRAALTNPEVNNQAKRAWDSITKGGANMKRAQRLLAEAVRSISEKSTQRAAESLFQAGGTALPGHGLAEHQDVEVIAWLALLEDEELKL